MPDVKIRCNTSLIFILLYLLQNEKYFSSGYAVPLLSMTHSRAARLHKPTHPKNPLYIHFLITIRQHWEFILNIPDISNFLREIGKETVNFPLFPLRIFRYLLPKKHSVFLNIFRLHLGDILVIIIWIK